MSFLPISYSFCICINSESYVSSGDNRNEYTTVAKLNKIKQRKFNFIFHFLIICVTMSFHILQCSNASRFQTATIHQCVELHFMHIRYMTHGYPLHGPFRSIVQSLRRRIFCLSSKLSLEERAL